MSARYVVGVRPPDEPVMLVFLTDAVGMTVTDLTHVLRGARAVPLNDAYKAAFGVSIAACHVDRTTGEVRGQRRMYGRYKPETLSKTNRAFRRLLISQGMSAETARKYVLVGDFTHAWTDGQVLLALVLRQVRPALTGLLARRAPVARRRHRRRDTAIGRPCTADAARPDESYRASSSSASGSADRVAWWRTPNGTSFV